MIEYDMMTDIAVTHIDDDGIADVVRCGGEYYVIERKDSDDGQWYVRCYSSVVPDDVLCIDQRTGNRFGDANICGYGDKRMCSEDLLQYLDDMEQTKLNDKIMMR